jgi:hypothetical protein
MIVEIVELNKDRCENTTLVWQWIQNVV